MRISRRRPMSLGMPPPRSAPSVVAFLIGSGRLQYVLAPREGGIPRTIERVQMRKLTLILVGLALAVPSLGLAGGWGETICAKFPPKSISVSSTTVSFEGSWIPQDTDGLIAENPANTINLI